MRALVLGPARFGVARLQGVGQVMAQRYKRTEAKLAEESAGRASYRTVLDSMLLRKMDWKK